MMTVRLKWLVLISCCAEVLWLLIAQIVNSLYLLIPCLVCFLGIVIWAAVKDMLLPVLLFFLPFAPILKIRPGTISFWTIALLLVYLVYLIIGSKGINVYHIIPALCLIAMCLVVRLAYGYSLFENSFILLCASLLMAPFLARDLVGKYDFYWVTLCFTLGIAIAAITSQMLVVFPNISRYVATHTTVGIIRRAGYYGDPNFYSAHISAALGGVLVILLKSTNKKKVIPLIFMGLLLLYCGFLSVSKSFMLVVACLVLFWFIAFLFKRGRMTIKVMTVITILVGFVFLLSTTIFTDLVDMMIARVLGGKNLSELTTGRTELWERYIKEFGENGLLLMFGKGFENELLGDRGPHNTILQAIYQFGLTGCLFFVSWIVLFIKNLLLNIKIKWRDLVLIAILLIGAVGPWMALDLLFFDELFLIPIYLCLGVIYISNAEHSG